MASSQELILKLLAGNPPDLRAMLESAINEGNGLTRRQKALLEMVVDVPTETDVEAASSDRAVRLTQIKRRIAELREERDEIKRRNDNLASALGACPECWGEDAQCPTCSGRGGPGFAVPNATAFAELVEPVIQRLKNLPGGER